jgi:hypothetical protein
VGTSASATTRFGPVTASARSLPLAIRSTTGSVVMNMNWFVVRQNTARGVDLKRRVLNRNAVVVLNGHDLALL